MSKSEGPRLPCAHPKYDPLTGTDYVRFKPQGARFSLLGHVLAPEGGEINAEIEGDEVRIRAERGGRVYTVPRSDVEALSGKALNRIFEKKQKDKQKRGLSTLRRKRSKNGGAPCLRELVFPPPEITNPAAPLPLRVVHCGAAALVPGPKEPPPVRCDAFLDFIHGLICIGCGNENRLIEAHHEGPHPLSVKTDDLLCVPLCAGLDGCHRFYTDHNHLPGRSREESLCLIEVAQRVLLVEFVQRLLALLATPAVAAGSAADQALLDLLDEQERSFVAEGGSHA